MLSRPGVDESSAATAIRPGLYLPSAEIHRGEEPQSLRPLAARLLEGQLARLRRANAVIERRLAQDLRELPSGSLYRRLGYVRLGDYLTERLGFSLRRCQELLRTERALSELPALAAVFESGQLPSSKIQVLAAVATPETLALWLARAQKLTVRQLEAQARMARVAAPAAPAAIDAPAATGASGEESPDVLVSFAAPGGVVALWHWALDLVRRVAGRQEPAWRCAEYLAAEYLAGAPAPAPSSPAASNLFVAPGSGTGVRGNSHLAGGGDAGRDRLERDDESALSRPRPRRDAAGLEAWSEATQAVREALRSLGAPADPDVIVSGHLPATPGAREDGGQPARGHGPGVDPWGLDAACALSSDCASRSPGGRDGCFDPLRPLRCSRSWDSARWRTSRPRSSACRRGGPAI